MDRCPICDVAVRPENLVRHLNDIHPRHPDTPKLVEEFKTQPGRAAARAPSRPFRVSGLQVSVLLVVVLLGVGTYYLLPYINGNVGTPLPCVSGTGAAYHWHTALVITSAGSPVTIPDDIGRQPAAPCMEVLHTHNTDGLIHIEPDTPEQARVYTVADFFLVWGKPFGAPTGMLVNGTPVTPSPSVGLYDQESIRIDYVSFTP
jgi:hypothetical protein